MNEDKFLQSVQSGITNYESDQFIFLRELAQNSRDAGATLIEVQAGISSKGNEFITFSDNGQGMTVSHARQYLFRLYASSKEDQIDCAGKFGIGFWTILKYQPFTFKIESLPMNGVKPWAIVANDKLGFQAVQADLKKPGTRILLLRKARSKNPTEFISQVKQALLNYCRFLKQKGNPHKLLPIILNGKLLQIEEETGINSYLKFSEGLFQGIVGLGRFPLTALYNYGLLIWKGTSLEELLDRSEFKSDSLDRGSGFFPVYHLNCDHLQVQLSRRRVIDDRTLRRLKRIAEKKFHQLLSRSIQHSIKTGLKDRLNQRLTMLIAKLKKNWLFQLLLILILLIPVELYILSLLRINHPTTPNKEKNVFPVEQKETNSAQSILKLISPAENFLSFRGNPFQEASVNEINLSSNQPETLAIYSPRDDFYFRIFSADRYDAQRGFYSQLSLKKHLSNEQIFSPVPEALNIILHTDRLSTIHLPCPTGYLIPPREIKIAGKTIPREKIVLISQQDLILQDVAGLITYRCYPQTVPPDEDDLIILKQIPENVRFNPELNSFFIRLNQLKKSDRLNGIRALVKTLINYDRSMQTAALFKSQEKASSWLEKVLRIGRGDCDVLNGVAALFLRKAGFPARLAIGFSGNKGRIFSLLHAWVEYYDDGWKNLDLTPELPINGNQLTELPVLSEVSEEKATRNLPQKQKFNDRSSLLLLSFTITALFISVLIVFFLRRKRIKINLHAPGMKPEEIAELLSSRLLYPQYWKNDFALQSIPLLPLLNGKKISLNRAIQLYKKEKLARATKESLVRFSPKKKSRLIILDASNPAFASLVSLLPINYDLDFFFRMEIISPENYPSKTVLKIKEIMEGSGLKAVELAINPHGADRLEYFHLPLEITERSTRFVLIPAGGKWHKLLTSEQSQLDPLTLFEFFKEIVFSTDFKPLKKKHILQRIAALFLNEAFSLINNPAKKEST